MRREIWRLYRHLLLCGMILLVACFLLLELANGRRSNQRIDGLVLADAELSLASAMLQSTGEVNPYSVFDWSGLTFEPGEVSVPRLEEVLSRLNLTQTDGRYKITFPLQEHTLAVQSLSANHFQIDSLIRQFLGSTGISDADKRYLLERMSAIQLTPASTKFSALMTSTNVITITTDLLEPGVIWTNEEEEVWVVTPVLPEPFQITITVVSIVAAAMVVMLVLIWRELSTLESTRKVFETITRQIARGRSGLPEGIPDSSGALKELAYSFDSMSSHIQRLLKVQREMINAISHELRTPIARLRFGLEVLKDEVDDHNKDTIEALEGDVEELNTLVDEVLTYGKLEEGSLTLHFGDTNVRQLVDGILQHNQPLLSQFEVEVPFDEDNSVVTADAHHLHRALQNLILNAAKYANSQIRISFSEDNERWQVDIEDDGPGISVEERERVFIPFQRLDNSRTRASGGYGLGLAIVQRIAFWHGGAVLIEDSELGGAKFSLLWSRSQHQKTLS